MLFLYLYVCLLFPLFFCCPNDGLAWLFTNSNNAISWLFKNQQLIWNINRIDEPVWVKMDAANRSQQAFYYSVASVQYVHMGTSTKNFAANLNMKSIRFFYLAGNWLICNLSIFSAWLYNCSKCTLLWNGMHFAFVMDSICLLVARVLQINKPMQNFPIGLFYFLHILWQTFIAVKSNTYNC